MGPEWTPMAQSRLYLYRISNIEYSVLEGDAIPLICNTDFRDKILFRNRGPRDPDSLKFLFVV